MLIMNREKYKLVLIHLILPKAVSVHTNIQRMLHAQPHLQIQHLVYGLTHSVSWRSADALNRFSCGTWPKASDLRIHFLHLLILRLSFPQSEINPTSFKHGIQTMWEIALMPLEVTLGRVKLCIFPRFQQAGPGLWSFSGSLAVAEPWGRASNSNPCPLFLPARSTAQGRERSAEHFQLFDASE